MVFFGNPVVQSPFQGDRGEVAVAFSGTAVLKLQVDKGCPFGIVLLVKGNVIAVTLDGGDGACRCLEPSVAGDDGILAELGLVDHDAELLAAFVAFCRELDQDVMVPIADERDFYIVPFEFLRDFGFAIDGILEESAALDFPAVVDAAARAKASCTYAKSCTEAKPCNL